MPAPSLQHVIDAIAELESLERTCQRLKCDRETLLRVLREGHGLPLFMPPARVRERMAQPSSPTPPPTPTETKALPALPVPRKATLYTDGASRGNPGPAGAGAVLVLGEGRSVRLGRFLGVQTNNVAEYEGVILGLEKALELGVRELDIRADSMLAMMQLKGEWKLKNEGLRPLFAKARELVAKFDRVTFQHIPREQNGAADEMSNRAIDEKL